MFCFMLQMIPVLIQTSEQLIHDNGLNRVRVGGIDQSIRIEVFGDLHEFGGIG